MSISLTMRLMLIKKNQRWLLQKLREAGYKTLYAPKLSAIVNQKEFTPSSKAIYKAAEKIISEEEKKGN